MFWNRDQQYHLLNTVRAGLIFLLALCSLGFSIQPVHAASTPVTYYVSPSGSNSNSGTSRDKPFKTIQHAADLVSPGDTVTVLAGSYSSERVYVTRSGSAATPITFQAEGSVTSKGFTVTANGIAIRGFYITGTADDWTDGWGIYVRGSDCLIESNHVYYATHGGILLYTTVSNPTVTSNCVVRDNQLERNSQVGIEVHGRNHLIEGNEVWGTIQYHPSWVNPPDWVDADGMHFFGSGHIFRQNSIHDIRYDVPENKNPHIDCFQTFANSDNEKASNVTFEQNYCSNDRALASDKDAFGKGFMLQNADHLLIRNNYIEAFSPVNVNGDSNISIVNNDIVGSLSVVMSYDTVGIAIRNGPNTLVENNLFYDLPNHIYVVYDTASQQGLQIGHNLAYRSDGQKPWDSPYPTDLWNVNPLLASPSTGDYHLQSKSPAIDQGANLTTVPADYDGNPRPQGSGTDIGAYEFQRSPNQVPHPVPSLTPAQIEFRASPGSTHVLTAPVQFSNTGAGGLTWTASSSQPWLTLSAASGAAPASLTASADPSGLPQGSENSATLTLTPKDDQSTPLTPMVITVKLTITSSASTETSKHIYLPLSSR
jgi:parallel beta-helix repeat protein